MRRAVCPSGLTNEAPPCSQASLQPSCCLHRSYHRRGERSDEVFPKYKTHRESGFSFPTSFRPGYPTQKELKLTSFFERAKICEKSGISSSELRSTISVGGGRGRFTTFGFDVDGTDSRGFFSRAGRERSFSERTNARNSSGVGSKAPERKMAFGLMSFIFLHTGPEFPC